MEEVNCMLTTSKKAPRLSGIRRLMKLTPDIPPCPLTTNQSEECPEDDHVWSPLPHLLWRRVRKPKDKGRRHFLGTGLWKGKRIRWSESKKKNFSGTSLMVQWLRLHAPNTEGTGLNPGQGTKIPHAVQPKKNCFLNNYFLAVPHGKQDLPQPGTEPMAPDALGVQSLNHWTTRKQKKSFFFLNKSK